MARRPDNFTWISFTPEQVELLEFLDHLGNNGWARNSQTQAVMPKLMLEFADSGVELARIKQAMAAASTRCTSLTVGSPNARQGASVGNWRGARI